MQRSEICTLPGFFNQPPSGNPGTGRIRQQMSQSNYEKLPIDEVDREASHQNVPAQGFEPRTQGL